MALNALSLSTTQGVQGRPFGAAIVGLTTGRVEVLGDGSPGFSTVNGRVSNASLPYPISTVVLREYEPGVGQGYRDSRIDIQGITRDQVSALAMAQVGAGRKLLNFRVAAERQADGTINYTVRVEDDLGATISTPVDTPTPTPGPTPPAAPSIAATPGNSQVSIGWSDNATGGSPITAHKIYGSNTQGFTPGAGNLIATVTTASPYVNSGVANGTARYYRVSAVNGVGEGPVSAEASATPSAGGQTANQTLLAAAPKDGSAIVAVIGGSRERQNGIGTGNNEVRSLPSGPLFWAYTTGRRFRTVWYNSNGQDTNSNSMGGLLYANDGEAAFSKFGTLAQGQPAAGSYQRLAAALASDAHVIVIPMSSNGVQANDVDILGKDTGNPLSAAGYIANYQAICQAAIAAGKAVIVADLIERAVFRKDGTAIGGPWASGTAARAQVPLINTAMKSWCQTQGIPFIEARPSVTTTQTNGSNTDTVPRNDIVRQDGTHWDNNGGYVIGKLWDAMFASLGWASEMATLDSAAAGNLVTNPGMTLGTSGSPAGYTRTRSGTVSTITATTVAKGGKQWLDYSIDRSTLGSAQEGVTETATVSNAVIGTWYTARVRFEVDAGAAIYGAPSLNATAGVSSKGMATMDASGSYQSDLTNLTIGQGPTEAYSGVIECMPFKATSTTATLAFRSPSWRADASPVKFRITDFEFRPWGYGSVTNPAQWMFNEAASTTLALTPASLTLSAPEEQAFATTIAANVPVRYTIAQAADAVVGGTTLFNIDGYGVIRAQFVPDFEDPKDSDQDNVYNLTITVTPIDPTLAPITQTRALTITDIADGFGDPMNQAAGNVAANTALWESSGDPASIQYTGGSQGIKLASATAEVIRPVAQQGDTVEQSVKAMTRIASTSAGAFCILTDLAGTNWLGVTQWTASAITVRLVMNGGTSAVYAVFTPYVSPIVGDTFDYQIRNVGGVYTLEFYMNGKRLALASGSDDVTSLVTGGGALAAVRKPGIIARSGTNTAYLRSYVNKLASARVDKIVLQPLTLTNDSLAANAVYAGTITGYTGAPNLVVTTDASGLFSTDGFNLRSSGPLGPAGTVYTVTVSESNDNAARPNPRATTFTITVPAAASAARAMSSRAAHNGWQGYAPTDGSDANAMFRMAYVNEMDVPVTSASLLYTGSTTNAANGDSDLAAAYSVTASIEYPAGTYTQVKWGGSATGVVNPGAILESDAATVTIPAGATFFVNTYTPSGVHPQNATLRTSRGEAQEFGVGVDKTMGGTITPATATGNRQGFGPSGIIAKSYAATPTRRSLVAIGSSTVAGTGDNIGDANGNIGFMGRAATGRMPYFNMGNPSAALITGNGTSMARRLALLAKLNPTHVIFDLYPNDIGAGSSASAIISAIQDRVSTIKAAVPGIKVGLRTANSRTTSTDGWRTLANQTVTTTPTGAWTGGVNSVRSQLNAAIRAGISGIDWWFEIADVLEPSRDDGRWITGESGTTIYLTNTGASTDASSVDGTHMKASTSGSNEYGGHFIARDAMVASLSSWPAIGA